MTDVPPGPAAPIVDSSDIQFIGRLPGDAKQDDDDGADAASTRARDEDDDDADDAQAVHAQQQQHVDGPVASTSRPQSEASSADGHRIVTLTSVSSDGQRSRQFHAKYFKPVLHDQPLQQMLDLPESYFQPTASELQQALAGQVRKREQLTDAPLLTSKLREREQVTNQRDKARRWPHTRIRIKFADRSQLEGVFPSTDKLVHVYEFVRLAIDEQHRAKPFVLYQSPPRREFVKGAPEFKGKSLMDMQLTPSSVFYVKFSNESLNASGSRPPLTRELLEAASDLPIMNPLDSMTATPATTGKSSGSGTSNKLPFGGAAGKVTPAWLKIGKSGSE
ncbi:hypothetical protein ACM66B_007099 [Microbotryomycetes sp. NB124-2]